MKIVMLLSVIPFFMFSQSQSRLQKGKYITSDKLKYLTIENDSMFEYHAYLYYSPYTIKEKRKNKKNISSCGSVGYWGDLSGRGKYKIIKGKVVLDFKINFSNISRRRRVIDFRLVRGIKLDINDLQKLN